jgi:hypothetical protein
VNGSGWRHPWEGTNCQPGLKLGNKKMHSRGRGVRQPTSITGRDGYLVLQALAYTILTIEGLPEKKQEYSNKEQMKTLLDVWSRGHSKDFFDSARFHLNAV